MLEQVVGGANHGPVIEKHAQSDRPFMKNCSIQCKIYIFFSHHKFVSEVDRVNFQ